MRCFALLLRSVEARRPVHWREGIHPLGRGDVITVRVVEAERPDPGVPTVSVPQS